MNISISTLRKLYIRLRHILSANLLKTILSQLHPVRTDKELIRLGPTGDGGYIVPDDFEGIHSCFSPGVDTISGFENECAERDMDVFLADASVENPPIVNSRFHFRKSFIGEKTQGVFLSMDDWIEQSIGGKKGDLLLQMDIEGHEYKALNAMSHENLKRFRIVVIEFHGLNYLKHSKIKAFKKLLKTHSCVHIHPNNAEPVSTVGRLQIPNLMEFTFLRNDRIHTKQPQTIFPHVLDSDNTDGTTLTLPGCWFH